MQRETFIEILDQKCKLVRTEYGLTQDKFALILGLTKKTLVQIEKGRKSMGWTNAVALASIFSDSTILNDAFGGTMHDIVLALAFKEVNVDYPKTWGGKLWWKTISKRGGYCLQQNLLSRHYRLLDQQDRRHFASFDLEEIESILNKLLE